MANLGNLAIISPALLVLAGAVWLATRAVGRPAAIERPAVDPASHRAVLARYQLPREATGAPVVALTPRALPNRPVADERARRSVA